MNKLCAYYQSSIGKKQIVAVTGLLLIGFLLGHLAGNLLIYLGAETFNNYAKKLVNLRPGLYLVEAGLFFIFVVHLYLTALLVLENIRARDVAYVVKKSTEQRSLATRLMPYSGTIILAFVVWHLLDFTFIDKHGPRSVLADGQDYGLYGIVYNAFTDPVHSILYIIAMFAIGLHLSHGLQSFAQTFGFRNTSNDQCIQKTSNIVAYGIALGYSTIPVYVMYQTFM